MKKNYAYLMIVFFFMTIMIAALNTCSTQDMATVKICIKGKDGLYGTNNKNYIEKLFLLWVQNAYAMAWPSSYDELALTVSGPGMDTIVAAIPPAESTYTLEVPAGSERLFRVIATNTTIAPYKNWGGHTISTLNPNEDVSLNISMIPMTKINSAGGSTQLTVVWESTSYAVSYNLYKALNPDGPYTMIQNTLNTFYDDFDVVFGTTYFYRVSVITAAGEGELCDYLAGTQM